MTYLTNQSQMRLVEIDSNYSALEEFIKRDVPKAMYDITQECYRGPATGIFYIPSHYSQARFIYRGLGLEDNKVYLSLEKVVVDANLPPPPGSECFLTLP